MTVYIHIGLAKTGSTSIQHTMWRNADFLRKEHSINYPSFAANHWPVALPFLKQEAFKMRDHKILLGAGTNETFLAIARKFVEEFKNDAGIYKTHVISSEGFRTLNRDSASGLRAFFEGLDLQAKIVVYVRHPAEWVSSLINQAVKNGRKNLENFVIEDNTTSTLRAYADAFGAQNLIVRRFGNQYFAFGGLIDDFMTTIHGKPIAGMVEERLNEAVSAPALLVADQLSDIAPWLSDKRRGLRKYLSRIAGPKFIAPRPVAKAAVEAHRECLAYLAEEFGIHFDPVDLSTFPETISREFPPETLRSIAELFDEQNSEIKRLKAEVKQLRGPLKYRIKRLLGGARM